MTNYRQRFRSRKRSMSSSSRSFRSSFSLFCATFTLGPPSSPHISLIQRSSPAIYARNFSCEDAIELETLAVLVKKCRRAAVKGTQIPQRQPNIRTSLRLLHHGLPVTFFLCEFQPRARPTRSARPTVPRPMRVVFAMYIMSSAAKAPSSSKHLLHFTKSILAQNSYNRTDAATGWASERGLPNRNSVVVVPIAKELPA